MATAPADKYDAKYLTGLKEKSKRARRYHEKDWLLNLAFLQGEQYVEYSPQNGRLIELAKPDGAIRTQRNAMFKIARIERAKLMRVPLTPIALPQSEDPADIMDATMLNAYFKWLIHEWQFPRVLRTAYFWVVATGNAFLKWFWDGGLGNQVAVVSPLDVYPDPYARSMRECRWMIHQQFYDVEAAKALFDVPGADTSTILPSSFDSISPSESAIFMSYTDGYNTLPGCVINEYWEPPSRQTPAGKHVLYTQDGVILAEDFPYEHGKMPFTHTGHVELANTKWFGSVMTQIRQMQMELNRTESQLVENRNLANGKWYIPPDLELNELPNAKPRQILQGKGNPQANPPALITPNPLPPEVWNEPQRLVSAMEDIAGQHEVSQGGVPGRVESGQAIQLLQETEDSVVKDVITSSEEMVATGFWMAGALYKQYGDVQTMLEVYDEMGAIEIHQLKKDRVNLKNRVVTQSTTALPFSTAGKADRVMLLWQNKLIDQPTALKLMGLTPENPDLDPAEVDRRQARRENLEMLKTTFGPDGKPSLGSVIRAKLYQNHAAHREEHDLFRKGADYAAAVAADPRIEALFDFHDNEHRQLDTQVAVEQAQKQAAVQAALAPPPPQGAAAPGPSAGPAGPPAPVAGPTGPPPIGG